MAKHFTKREIDEIEQALIERSKKDTSFPEASALSGDELVPIVQNGENKTTTYSALDEKITHDAMEYVREVIDSKVDKVQGKGLSTNDYDNIEKQKVAEAYHKPSSGIPASDIADGVIPDVSQFITRTVNDLVNYYLKSEVYNKLQVDSLIAAVSKLSYVVVDVLPEASDDTMNKIYLVPSSNPKLKNVKDEFFTIRIESQGEYIYYWEQFGSTSIDLDDYITTEELNTALASYTTTANLTELLSQKQDVISDLSSIRSGAAAGSTAYQKPSSGIPKSDLTGTVQISLDKADSSLQFTPSGEVDPQITPADYATRDELNQLGQQVIYDVTKNNPTAGPNNDGKFESLSALLLDANLSTLIPSAVRCGGMSIRFVQSTDNKYVQYRLTEDSFTTDIGAWLKCEAEILTEKTSADLTDGYYSYINNTLSFSQFASWGYKIIPLTEDLYIETASGASASIGVPAVIFLSDKNPITENVVGVAYGDIPTTNDSIRIFKGMVNNEDAKYVLINYSKTIGNNYQLFIKTRLLDVFNGIENQIKSLEKDILVDEDASENLTHGFYTFNGTTLSFSNNSSWGYKIYPADAISYIETCSGDNTTTIPALIYLSNSEATTENVIGVEYGTIQAGAPGQGLSLYKGEINNNNAKYVIINYNKTVGDSYDLNDKIKVNGLLETIKKGIGEKPFVVVAKDGTGKYTSVVDAIANEPADTPIFVKPGIYDGTVRGFGKRIILVGADRNKCIIRSTDCAYANPAMECSCGYFENLTFFTEYIQGVSQEVPDGQNWAYAVHRENDYGKDDTLEFHHCTMISDVYPAMGIGMVKGLEFIIDDCRLITNQTRGRFMDEGGLGALFLHDSAFTKGECIFRMLNCSLMSKSGTTIRLSQSIGDINIVNCEFIGNSLADETNGRTNIFKNINAIGTEGNFELLGTCFGNSEIAFNV